MAEAARADLALFTAKSALNESGTISLCGEAREIMVYVAFSSGTTAGAVAVETSADSSYAGTWAPIETITWQAASRTHYIGATGSFRIVRARISTAIVGGTADAWITAN